MQHHRTTRKKSFLNGLAPSNDTFARPNWTPVDHAVRRARWDRLRAERESRSAFLDRLWLVGALFILLMGISATTGPQWNPLEQAQTTQRAAMFAIEAERAAANEARDEQAEARAFESLSEYTADAFISGR
ncbi:hypothetical protein CRI94_16550 [Longibacter salinarum]|uniref:Transmembrane protein n=2 Tax=Longibacter salinarum TaxID=1850348 RepID=A0A2A8CTT9_9BACT|nr:hypothetical protein CRI94_16550 [Longibacter salinarum]